MDIIVHITYFPMEAKYGASLWDGDTIIDMDYNLYDNKKQALKAGVALRNKVEESEEGK